jgi:acyl-CoA-binding protein
MADVKQQFEKAAGDVKSLKERPSNDQLLKLYGLYKQATEGDVTGPAPGLFDPKGKAKHSAWTRVKGMSKDAAMEAYVKLVESMKKG